MEQKSELAGKRIIVTGAGLAGLAFAIALNRSWPQQHPKPELVIYERSSKAPGYDGYTMGIKKESGLKALDQLGLLDIALSKSTVGMNGIQQLPTFWTKDWHPMLDINPYLKSNDRVPPTGIRLLRKDLRQMLMDSLPVGTNIHWETGCDSMIVLEGGNVRVSLSNGSTDDCDLLVAADGANSSARSALLPDDTLDFAGAICFLGTSKFPSGKPEAIKHSWGMTLGGKGATLLTFPVDSETGVWGLTYRSDQPRERVRGKEAIQRQEELLDEVRQRGSMFGEPFNQIIDATDASTLQVFSAQHKSPIQHSRKLPHANIVLIGDANHPLSPFSGQGANMALMDSVELAKQLSSCERLRSAIDNFDAESAPRSQKAINRGRLTIVLLHLEGLAFWAFRLFLAVISFAIRLWK